MEAGFLWKENGDQAGAVRMSGGHKDKSLDWDLNDWRWDANLFLATPAAAAPSGSSSRELSRAQGEIDFGVVVDKRRRLSPEEDGSAGCSNNSAVVANGDNSHVVSVQRSPSSEEERPRKGASSSNPPSCQVDGCHADLSGARDYHKRHKVCEAHTRTSMVRIKNVEHRFCQQCSRFHLIQEFDEGKKSCRSRLAKHNGRRRKGQPQGAADGNSTNENQSLNSTLFLLLKQLSGLESGSSSEQINHPNYLVNLLKNLAAIASTQAYQDILKNANLNPTSNAGNNATNGPTMHELTKQSIPAGHESLAGGPPSKKRVQDFDLNGACTEEVESRTDKIVFKLFGKEPRDFPVDLREQILNWLSHCPTDMESYIRPGCVILTVYLCLPNWMWDEVVFYFITNALDMCTLMLASPWQPVMGDKLQRLCVTPIAVACSSTAKFCVQGFNIVQPTTKLLCVFGEKYLIQEETQMLLEDTTMQEGPQCLTFSCSFPSTSGRGFIEVEDYDQSSLSVPFVVTDKDQWCAVVKKLLNTMFRDDIDLDIPSPIEFSLGEAAISDGIGVLDALTDDPQQLGIKAWKNARDDTGLTPEDYAQKRGHISYMQMVQDKIDQRLPKAQVSVAIPSRPSATDTVGKHASQMKSTAQTRFDVESQRSISQLLSCGQCVRQVQLTYGPRTNKFLSTRPAMLSLVAIAAVCVCVGLIMKSPPQVGSMKPFLWDKIRWGPN
nr:unnamed protein product [Digitaria exilis]